MESLWTYSSPASQSTCHLLSSFWPSKTQNILWLAFRGNHICLKCDTGSDIERQLWPATSWLLDLQPFLIHLFLRQIVGAPSRRLKFPLVPGKPWASAHHSNFKRMMTGSSHAWLLFLILWLLPSIRDTAPPCPAFLTMSLLKSSLCAPSTLMCLMWGVAVASHRPFFCQRICAFVLKMNSSPSVEQYTLVSDSSSLSPESTLKTCLDI